MCLWLPGKWWQPRMKSCGDTATPSTRQCLDGGGDSALGGDGVTLGASPKKWRLQIGCRWAANVICKSCHDVDILPSQLKSNGYYKLWTERKDNQKAHCPMSQECGASQKSTSQNFFPTSSEWKQQFCVHSWSAFLFLSHGNTAFSNILFTCLEERARCKYKIGTKEEQNY